MAKGRRPRAGRTTIYDVAERAGVSLATVSRVINGSAPVSDPIRERVEAAARELGFRPSLVASSLARRETKTFGLVVPDIANPFFAQLIGAVEREAARRGYAVFVCGTDERPAQEEAYIDALSRRGVDGLLLCTGNQRAHELAQTASMAVVNVARDLPPNLPSTDAVILDDRMGGAMATRYLLSRGHRRIAYVGERPEVRSSEERRLGYLAAMERAGVAVPDDWMMDALSLSSRHMDDLVRRLRQAGVTAACTASDMVALRVITALRRQGIRIPQDLAIVSFDDTPLATLLEPPLTSVHQPIARMGRLAVEILLTRLANMGQDPQPPAIRKVMRPRLVVRGSTAP